MGNFDTKYSLSIPFSDNYDITMSKLYKYVAYIFMSMDFFQGDLYETSCYV